MLRIRCWRRGTREMDIILGTFSDTHAALLNKDDLATFESLLDENDHNIYAWISGKIAAPTHFNGLLELIRSGNSFNI